MGQHCIGSAEKDQSLQPRFAGGSQNEEIRSNLLGSLTKNRSRGPEPHFEERSSQARAFRKGAERDHGLCCGAAAVRFASTPVGAPYGQMVVQEGTADVQKA